MKCYLVTMGERKEGNRETYLYSFTSQMHRIPKFRLVYCNLTCIYIVSWITKKKKKNKLKKT